MSSTLKEFRAQHPVYDDLPDMELADALHKKFYSDLPKDEFLKTLGVDTGPTITERLTAAGDTIRRARDATVGTALRSGAATYDRMQNVPERLAQSFAGAARMYAEERKKYVPGLAEGSDKMIEQAREITRLADENMVPLNVEPGTPEYYVSEAIGATVEMAPSLALSALMRNPGPTMAFVGVHSGGQAYESGRAEGLDHEQATQYAILYALAEAIPERVPVSELLKPGASFLTRVVKGAATEGAQEMLTEALQIGIDMGYVTDDMTWEEARQRVIDSGIIGSIAGTGMAGVVEGTERAAQAVTGAAQSVSQAAQEIGSRVAARVRANVAALRPVQPTTRPAAEAPFVLSPQDRVTAQNIARPLMDPNAAAEPSPTVEDAPPIPQPENFERNALDFIGSIEAPRGYDQVYSGSAVDTPKPLSSMTIAEVRAWQRANVAAGSPSSAAGRFQVIGKTLERIVGKLGLSQDTVFSPEIQDRIAIELMRERGLDEFRAGTITAEQFGNRLAQEWAALPVVSGEGAGQSYYAGAGLNAAQTSVEEFLGVLAGQPFTPREASSGGSGITGRSPRVAGDGRGDGPGSQVVVAEPVAAPQKSELPEVAQSKMVVAVGGKQYPVETFEQASEMVQKAIAAGDFGSSQTPQVGIVDPSTGEQIAYVSYNGKVWAGAEYKADATPLYDPSAPVPVIAGTEIEVDPNPTEAQKEAGNYKKGHTRFAGFDITIENAKGSERSGVSSNGSRWSVTMPAHYGYIRRTEGNDGDHVDVYIGDREDITDRAFIVNQVDPSTDRFDEHKLVVGVETLAEAQKLYDAAFSDGRGPSRRMSVHQVTMDELRTWLDKGSQKKPFEPASKPVEKVKPKPAPKPEPQKPAPAPKPASQEAKAKKLRKAAAGALEKAEEKQNADRQTNTARRARMAASAEADAAKAAAQARTLGKVADAIQADPSSPLVTINSLADISRIEGVLRTAQSAAWKAEKLDYAQREKRKGEPFKPEYIKHVPEPRVLIRQSEGTDLLNQSKGLRGVDRSRLKSIAGRSDGNFIYLTNADDIAAVESAIAALRKKGALDWSAKNVAAEITDYKALIRLYGDSRAEFLAAYLEIRDGRTAPKVDPVEEARRALIGVKIPGFFETPVVLAKRMVEEAELFSGAKVLEPSAGLGRIANAAAEIVGKKNVDVVEINGTLRESLEAQGFDVIGTDIMEIEPAAKYDAVLMNPPFEKRQDMEHVMRAWDHLKPSGKLVAIMGEGVFFGSDAKANEFRAWLAEIDGTAEKLPAGTFKESGTGTNTRLVVITKPAERGRQAPPKKTKRKKAKPLPATKEEIELFRKTALQKLAKAETELKAKWKAGDETTVTVELTSPTGRKMKYVLQASAPGIDAVKRIRAKIKSSTQSDLALNELDNVALNFDVPMPNHQPMWRDLPAVQRATDDTFNLAGDSVQLPPMRKPMQREPVRLRVEKLMGARVYQGKVKGRTRLGYYSRQNGQIRLKHYDDLEVLAHELAHWLDFNSTAGGVFNVMRKRAPKIARDQMKNLSYTSNPNLVSIEGFAEYIRLWLTQYDVAVQQAPDFTNVFESTLARHPKIEKQMREIRRDMHIWRHQGALAQARGNVGAGDMLTATKRFMQSRPTERFRQQAIDAIHGIKVAEREVTGTINAAERSPFKLMQLVNGSEGVYEAVLRWGTPKLERDGSFSFRGKPLNEIFKPLYKMGPKAFDDFLTYAAGRRAQELKTQGREKLFDRHQIEAMLALERPEYVTAFDEYQTFNGEMLEFYEQMGLLEKGQRQAFQAANAAYIPFHRVSNALNQTQNPDGQSINARLRGGTQNVRDLAENIVENLATNIRAAMVAHAKRTLYATVAKSDKGAGFAVRLAPDSRLVRAHVEEMAMKVAETMARMGFGISDNGMILAAGTQGSITDVADIANVLEQHPDILMLWQHNQNPATNESYVDSVVMGGKRTFFEVNDPVLVDSLTAHQLQEFGIAMRIGLGFRRLYTRTITNMVQFIMPNITRDTLNAATVSDSRFRPVWDSLRGMWQIMTRSDVYKDWKLQGGGYASFVEALTKEGRHRAQLDMPSATFMDRVAKALAAYDAISAAFENATRVGEFMRAQERGAGKREAAYRSREVSTDFSKKPGNPSWSNLLAVIPFANASLQGNDRLAKAFIGEDGRIRGGRIGMHAAKRLFFSLGTALASFTAMLWVWNNSDDDRREQYEALTPDQKSRFWHIFLPGRAPIQIPRPYGVGLIFADTVENALDMIKDRDGAALAENMAFAIHHHFFFLDWPGVAQPIFEEWQNKTFTGAPIVPPSLETASPELQFTDRTPELYKAIGERTGLSPLKVQHYVSGYLGYVENFMSDAVELMLWDAEEWGPKPFARGFEEYFLKQYKGSRVSYRTRYTEGYYDLRQRAAQATADLAIAERLIAREGTRAQKVMVSELNQALGQLNGAFRKIDSVLADGRDAMIAVKYDKKLSREEKEAQIEAWYRERHELVKQFYTQAEAAIAEIEQKVENK